MPALAGNEHERAARLAKAERLVACLDRSQDEGEPRSPEEMVELLLSEEAGPDWWAGLAEAAGVNPPSSATQALIVGRFRERARQAAEPDPFAGL